MTDLIFDHLKPYPGRVSKLRMDSVECDEHAHQCYSRNRDVDADAGAYCEAAGWIEGSAVLNLTRSKRRYRCVAPSFSNSAPCSGAHFVCQQGCRVFIPFLGRMTIFSAWPAPCDALIQCILARGLKDSIPDIDVETEWAR